MILATRAASGKSAGYLAAALSEVLDGGTVLYIAPTKALAADQLKAVRDLGVPGVRATCYDGDSTVAERAWAQSHANYLLTNPDMLHSGLLPNHARWRGFFRRLRVVIIDECHGYRGVFGSHVAQVLRRLRRVAAHHGVGQPPVFILASATIADPAACARALTGLEAVAVTDDGSPRAPVTFALWEPPLLHTYAEVRARRPATTEAADLLAALVKAEVPALAFIRSRRGAETVALAARDALDEELSGNVAAYRSGYLPDDRRGLEAGLRDGRITGMATTSALELGINITGLDAVLIAGWPGTWASLWQQAGRAGRAGHHATAVFIARDDPLDSYLVHHPDALLHHPVEPSVLDPANPYVLGPHLAAAAAELPLTEPDLDLFGSASAKAVAGLGAAGELRRRPSGWYYARHRRPARDISIRGDLGRPVRVVEEATGRLVGTMDEPSAHRYVHDGAVYLHQGESYLVSRLDLADRVALVEPGDPGYTTQARDVTDIDVIGERRRVRWGDADLMLTDVRVTRQVVEYARLRSGKKIREAPVGARAAAADAVHGGRRLDHPERVRGPTPRQRPRRGGPRGGARGDRAPAAVRDLRPVGRGRPVHRTAPGDRPAHRVRLRRPRRRGRLRGARLRGRRRLADRHQERDQRLPVRDRLPLLRPVPQVRQRQLPAVQGRRRRPPRPRARQRPVGLAELPGAGAIGSAEMALRARPPDVRPEMTLRTAAAKRMWQEAEGPRPRSSRPKAAFGGVGVVPHSEQETGKRAEGREQGKAVPPSPGGRARGDHTVRPWGVGRLRSVKLIRSAACRRWTAINP